jgi:tellurite resistance protein
LVKVNLMNANALLQPAVEALCNRFPSNEAGVAAAIDLAVLVAAADGHIDPAEMAALSTSLEVAIKTHLSPMFVKHLVQASRLQIDAAGGASSRAKLIGESIAAQGCVDEGLRLALVIALASDGLSDIERDQIKIIANAAGASPERVDTLCRELQAAGSA